jgi:hypothetical protein
VLPIRLGRNTCENTCSIRTRKHIIPVLQIRLQRNTCENTCSIRTPKHLILVREKRGEDPSFIANLVYCQFVSENLSRKFAVLYVEPSSCIISKLIMHDGSKAQPKTQLHVNHSSKKLSKVHCTTTNEHES